MHDDIAAPQNSDGQAQVDDRNFQGTLRVRTPPACLGRTPPACLGL